MSGIPPQPARIVWLDRETLPDDISVAPFSFPHEIVQFKRTELDQVAERIRDADIVITNKVPLRHGALAPASRLRLIAVAATGTDNVDIATCTEQGIAVSNIRNYALNTVPEHTFALILALRRNLLAYRESVVAERWQESINSATSTIRSVTLRDQL